MNEIQILSMIFTAGIIWFIVWYVKKEAKKNKVIANRLWYCPSCGHTGKMQMKRAGSAGITFLLFCCFIIPALIYSSWRWNNRSRSCPKCNNKNVIPADSPKAKKETIFS